MKLLPWEKTICFMMRFFMMSLPGAPWEEQGLALRCSHHCDTVSAFLSEGSFRTVLWVNRKGRQMEGQKGMCAPKDFFAFCLPGLQGHFTLERCGECSRGHFQGMPPLETSLPLS